MQTVILAGGLGTRLRSVAPDIPKALVTVAGRPFIEHQFALLRKHGLTRILLCVGHLGEMIVQHVGDGAAFGMQVRYSHENPNQLMGTGGALLNAWPLLDETFVVMYGDSYLPTDYSAVIRAFEHLEPKAMMTVFRNEGKWDPSNVRIAGDKVVFYSKKAKPGEADYIDYGMTLYQRSVFEVWRSAPLPLDLAKVQSSLVEEGSMAAFEVHERFYEVGKPEGLAEMNALLEARK
jgi:NDP-sugar pyrophosphorylase family protein